MPIIIKAVRDFISSSKPQTRKDSKPPQKVVHHDTAWSNPLSNLGVKNRDKRLAAQINPGFLDRATVESLYQVDDSAARIVIVFSKR